MPSPCSSPASHLALTQAYYAKYKTISKLLDQTPELVALAHGDLAHSLAQTARSRPAKTRFCYTGDNVLRVPLVQLLEGLSLREARCAWTTAPHCGDSRAWKASP